MLRAVTGYRFSHWAPPIEGFCNMPRVMVDVSTGEWYHGRCGSARPSRCAPCSEVKRGDIAAIGRSGWIDNPADRGYFITLTAPGADVLPWDRSRCSHSPGVPCSGSIGCQVESLALALWHDGVGQRWSWFMTEVRRLSGVDVQFFKTWELQRRGALHLHSMMRPDGVISDRRFRAAIRLAASRYGFGGQVDVQVFSLSDTEAAARSAGYVAKYASKSADDLPTVARCDRYTGEIRPVGLRSWSSSRRWGDTMASIRLRRCQWAATTAAGTVAGDPTPGAAVGGALDSNQGIYANGDQSGSVLVSVSAAQPL